MTLSPIITTLTIYNLSVKLSSNDSVILNHLRDFIRRYYTVAINGFGKDATTSYKVFFGAPNQRSFYVLHKNQFLHFVKYLRQFSVEFKPTSVEDKREYTDVRETFSVRPEWSLRDYQKPVVDFILDNPKQSKLIPLRTGTGKTFISLYALAQLNSRIGIVILPVYIDKWVNDIIQIHNASVDDILVIQGSTNLIKAVELAKQGELNYKYIIISNRTLQGFINAYEENMEYAVEKYGIEPLDLFPLLGIGNLLIDETHQHFHALFKILLYTNVKFHIGLSATLLSEDRTVRLVHQIVYPDSTIYKESVDDNYIDVYPITYSISDRHMKFIRTTFYKSNAYSHIAFEKSIIRNKLLKEGYFKIITGVIEDYFIEHYLPNDKLLIFVSTIDLGRELQAHLAPIYTQFKVNTYFEDDSYERLEQSDIIISTIISAGTAVDIKNLRVVIQTVSINSPVANLQNLGRLRKLTDRDVKFCYLYSDRIPKHKEYHFKKVELFEPKVAHIVNRRSRYSLT